LLGGLIPAREELLKLGGLIAAALALALVGGSALRRGRSAAALRGSALSLIR
jgi:hypothetical protein